MTLCPEPERIPIWRVRARWRRWRLRRKARRQLADGFREFQMPIIQAPSPGNLIEDLIPLQPMQGPTATQLRWKVTHAPRRRWWVRAARRIRRWVLE